MGTLTKHAEVVWAHVFDKPQGSRVNKHEDEGDAGDSRNFFESDPLNHMPITPLGQMQNAHGNPFMHKQERIPNHHPETMDNNGDDGSC